MDYTLPVEDGQTLKRKCRQRQLAAQVESPRVWWRLRSLGRRQDGRGGLTGLKRFKLGRWAHAELAVQALIVEPVDVLQGGIFDVFEPAPGTAVADQLGFVQTVEGFRQGVIVAVAAGADGRDDARLGQALRVPDREILHPPI